MLAEIMLFMLVMIAGTSGELCIARAMRTVGEATDFRPRALLQLALRAVKVRWTWVGLALMTVGFLSLLQVLSIENVSLVVPVTALSYVVGALGGKLFLHERVTRARWAGVALVCIGVTLLLVGK